jgi:hypothetical protein
MFVKIAAAGVLALGGIAVAAPVATAQPSPTAVAVAPFASDSLSSDSKLTTPEVATSEDGEVKAQIAGWYTVYNATGQTLTLVNHWMNDGTWEGAEPINGTTVRPGHSYQFGVTLWFLRGNQGILDFQIGDTDEYLRVTAVPQFAEGVKDSHFLNGTGKYTTSVGGDFRSTLALTSSTPVVHDLPAGEGQAQYEALRQLCDSTSFASCTFTPTSRVTALAPEKRVTHVFPNEGPTKVNYIYEWSSTTTTTSEWGVEATLSTTVANIVEVSVAAHYNESIEHSEQTGGSVEVPVKPNYAAWLTFQAPIYRVTGDFTITVGNETWNLTDVHFDVPRTDTNLGVLRPYQYEIGDPRIPDGDDVF